MLNGGFIETVCIWLTNHINKFGSNKTSDSIDNIANLRNKNKIVIGIKQAHKHNNTKKNYKILVGSIWDKSISFGCEQYQRDYDKRLFIKKGFKTIPITDFDFINQNDRGKSTFWRFSISTLIQILCFSYSPMSLNEDCKNLHPLNWDTQDLEDLSFIKSFNFTHTPHNQRAWFFFSSTKCA